MSGDTARHSGQCVGVKQLSGCSVDVQTVSHCEAYSVRAAAVSHLLKRHACTYKHTQTSLRHTHTSTYAKHTHTHTVHEHRVSVCDSLDERR